MSDSEAQPKAHLPHPTLVECPQCKQPGFVEAWPHITNTVDKKAMELLLAGKLFEYTCPVCGTAVAMTYDCMLRDVERGAILLYSTDRDTEKNIRRLNDLLEREDCTQGRLTTSTFEFCEKARLWGEGYDDRAIELMKVAIKRGMLKEGIIGSRDILIYERTMPNGGVSFVVMGEIPGDVVGVPGGYDYCMRFLADAEAQGKLEGEYRFDAAWANRFLP